MLRPKLAIDMDGVVYNLMSVLQWWMSENYNIQFDIADITDWHLSRTEIPITKKQLHRFLGDKEHFTLGEPYEDAIEGLHRLAQVFDVHYVTSRPPNSRNATMWWLQYQDAPNPTKVLVAQDKLPICQDLQVWGLVDDKPETLAQFREAGIPALTITRPWNDGAEADLRFGCWWGLAKGTLLAYHYGIPHMRKMAGR